MLQKKYLEKQKKKKSCFHAYDQVFQKYKKFHIVFSYKKIQKKNVLPCILSFNNQFIKAMWTRLIFQKYQKKYFVFF
jgi:hypothetical protein